MGHLISVALGLVSLFGGVMADDATGPHTIQIGTG